MAKQAALESLARILPAEASSNDAGHLTIGGVDVVELAEEFGTPLQVFDEAGLRRGIRRIVDGLSERWPNSEVIFASKSLPLVAMYAIAAAEGVSVDVAGEGELRLALAAGVEPARLHLHGNAKTDAEIAAAVEVGVGTIVVDGPDDIARLDRLVPAGKVAHIIIRVIPGVEVETHDSMKTGGSSSKFGVLPSQARELIESLRGHERISVDGVHLHIGSQILDAAPFGEAVHMLESFSDLDVFDVGGGLGVAYTEDDVPPSVDDYLDAIVGAACAVLPAHAKLLIEPGRSLVARAGVTAYRITTLKTTGRTFAALNGGTADFLEMQVAEQPLSALVADRATSVPDTTVRLVGRQCDSGDLFADEAALNAPRVGDTVVVAATGAYSYTTSNNYNGAVRPAVVFVANGTVRVAARRERVEELLTLQEPAFASDWSTLPEAAFAR